MKHLEPEQLKKYGERRLSAAETSRIILHLDNCGACFERLRQTSPAVSDAAREVSLDVLTADEAETFHLDYEEHLRPFVDGQADAVIVEIVESHSANCAFCVRAVRELREFGESLRLAPEIETKDFARSPHHRRGFSIANAGRLFLSAAAILILGIGGWLFWRQTATQNLVAESETPQTAPSVAMNENNFRRQAENPAENREIKEKDLPIVPREDVSINKKTAASDDKNRASKPTKDEILIAALPPNFRLQFQNAVRTQEIKLPAFINDLRENGNLRGESGVEKNSNLAPAAQAVRDLRPVFKWQKFAAAESYVVTIYDENFNPVAVSLNLRETKWQSNVPLQRGKIYIWQVRNENSSASYSAQFKVLDANALARLKKIENAAADSPLVRGIGYASEGLLIEAEQEFQKEMIKHPRRSLAKKLKDSLAKSREQK